MNYFCISDPDLRSFKQEMLQLDELVGENEES